MIIKTSYSFMKPPPSARLIRGHRLAQGFVGLWLFSEDGGRQVFDLSGNGLNGTLVGDVSWVPGNFGTTLDFPGSNDYIEFAHHNLLNLDDSFTLIAWVKTIFASAASDRIFSKRGPLHNFEFRLRGDLSGNLHFTIYDGTTSPDVYGNTSVIDDVWHQVVAVRNVAAGKLQIYIDGVLDAEANDTTTGSIINNNVMRIGIRNDTLSGDFNGLIDIPSIYNRALSVSEIAELNFRPFAMFERKARTALISGYAIPPIGMAGAMTTNTGYWGW